MRDDLCICLTDGAVNRSSRDDQENTGKGKDKKNVLRGVYDVRKEREREREREREYEYSMWFISHFIMAKTAKENIMQLFREIKSI